MEYNWKEYKEKRLEELKSYIETTGISPTLAVIQVGDIPESNTYVRNKMNACNKIGIKVVPYIFREGATHEGLRDLILKLNEDKNINGILIQLPIPGIDNPDSLINLINSIKDVDGLTCENYSKLAYKLDGLVPCTPKGIMEMLSYMNVELDGSNVVIIGRSRLVGLPLFHLLENQNATVTMCHSHTKNLEEYTRKADILITAVGNHKNLITAEMVKEGAYVIDVAISRDEETGKLYGDVDYESVKYVANYVTPVPGGVGQLTVLELMNNVVNATALQLKK